MKKTFVLDTNVLLSNPEALFTFDDNDVVSELAKCVTMLAIEDWNDLLVDTFLRNIKTYIDNKEL